MTVPGLGSLGSHAPNLRLRFLGGHRKVKDLLESVKAALHACLSRLADFVRLVSCIHQLLQGVANSKETIEGRSSST
jgi:hypothetical protein